VKHLYVVDLTAVFNKVIVSPAVTYIIYSTHNSLLYISITQ